MSGVIGQAVAIGRQVAAQYRADPYDLTRGTSQVADGEGGYTTTPTVIESGTCILAAGALQPREQAIADQAGATVAYAVRNMPYTSGVQAGDDLMIGGRTFHVLGVPKVEVVRVTITAVCEERT
jgi:head-tail adaptor